MNCAWLHMIENIGRKESISAHISGLEGYFLPRQDFMFFIGPIRTCLQFPGNQSS